MSHNDHNFKYIEDKNKERAGKTFQRFELRDGDCLGDDGWGDCEPDRERVEFSAKPEQRPKKTQCYGYSLMLTEDFYVQQARGADTFKYHEHTKRPVELMCKKDVALRKKANEELSKIFYSGAKEKGKY